MRINIPKKLNEDAPEVKAACLQALQGKVVHEQLVMFLQFPRTKFFSSKYI
jgi:hypothetical protein